MIFLGGRAMPRFGEMEKEKIRHNLMTEGERLFATFGLKKVTIDDLIEAGSIAKATFYTFYDCKEELYLEIVQDLQKKVFEELETLLYNHADRPNKERVRQVFELMERLMRRHPILSAVTPATIELLLRKVSKERILAYTKQKVDAAQALLDHGIRFTCSVQTASVIFQALYRCFLHMQGGTQAEQAMAIGLMLDGVIDKIVVESC
jgi:AcrR family transcriptional regulator